MSKPPMGFLMSYWYYKDPEMAVRLTEMGLGVLVDSGAFTAYTGGKVINLQDYAHYAKHIHGKVDGYFTLDEIGDEEKTKENHATLRRKKLKPIAIWQSYDPSWAGFESWLKGEEYVSLGAIVATRSMRTSKNFSERRVRAFLNKVNGRAKTHLLGWVPKQWASVPCTSMDSSTYKSPLCFNRPFRVYSRDGRPVWFEPTDSRAGKYSKAQRLIYNHWVPSVPMRKWEDHINTLGRKTRFQRFMAILAHISRHRLKGPRVYCALSGEEDVLTSVYTLNRMGLLSTTKAKAFKRWYWNRRK